MTTQNLKNFKISQDKFSGPLDLLISLIEAHKMEITEISLAKVTDEFLTFLGDIKKCAPGILAEFLAIASKLLLIKSRAILPTLEISQEEEEDIGDFAHRLEIYQQFRLAAKNLKEIFNHQPLFAREFLADRQAVFFPPEKITADDLKKSFEKIWQEFEKITEEIQVEKVVKVANIEEKIKEILVVLSERINLSFRQLSQEKSKPEVVVSFLAILQMFKDQVIQIEQEDVFGEIRLGVYKKEKN